MAYFGRIKIPKTKTGLKQRADALILFGILFGVGAFATMGVWFVSRNRDLLVLSVVFGFMTPLMLGAGIYNRYYIRRMQHPPLMAKALANPMITVFGILLFLFVVIFGGIAFLISLK